GPLRDGLLLLATPGRLRLGLLGRGRLGLLARATPRVLLRDLSEDKSDVARSLPDPVDATAGTRLPAFQGRPLVRERGFHHEAVAVEAVLRFGVGDRRAEHLLDVRRGSTRREGEDRPRFGDAAAANVLEHDPRLASRRAHPLRLRADAHAIVLL